jgi:hypothetical protein
MNPVKGALGVLVAIVVLVAAFSGHSGKSNSSSGPDLKDAASVNDHSRAYIGEVRRCMEIASVAISLAAKEDIYSASDSVKQAANTCDDIRSELATMDSDHFDKQATTAWGGVDRIKSGLNATVAYLDTQYPSKLVEARDKLHLGMMWARIGIRGINLRRQVYGLGKI